MLKTLREHAGWDTGRQAAHDPHQWWLFNSKQTSGKTCPTCLALHMTHYRGDEIPLAFPYHIHKRVNAIKAMVHPHCRCVLEWTGRKKDVTENPYGILKRPARRAELPDRVAGTKISLSPSQKRLFNRTVRYSRETWRNKHERERAVNIRKECAPPN